MKASSEINIMVVDDDDGVLDVVCLVLESEGYQVKCISNSHDLKLGVDSLPDLLLLDVSLRGADGRDICRKLKSEPTTRNLPIVLFSAGTNVEESALASGANDFLAKPFDIQDLLDKVHEHLPG